MTSLKVSQLIQIIIVSLLFYTTTINTQWAQISTIGNNELRGVVFFDEQTGVVCGASGIWRSTTSGINWTHVWNVADMNALSFINSSTGLAAGNNGRILKTTDGGLTWNVIVTSVSENLYAIDWANASICWAVGQAGRILKSSNYGNSWFTQTNTLSDDLKAVYMPDPLNGFIAGGNSRELVLSTINGGNTWFSLLNEPGNFLTGIYVIPNNNYKIAVGSNGRIRRTITGGMWPVISSGTNAQLNSIQFVDLSTGYIAGNNGTILKSTNAGGNWTSQQSNTTNYLNSIYFINTLTGWAVGQNGIVLRTGIPVGLQNYGSEIPVKFRLYQNYPNPFNPKTKIKFSVPATGKNNFVKIIVYDVTGKQITTLVDENFAPGSYEVDFNGENYSSGVYFYRMITNDYSEVKKMILVK